MFCVPDTNLAYFSFVLMNSGLVRNGYESSLRIGIS